MKTQVQSLVGVIICLFLLTSCAVPIAGLVAASYVPTAYVATKAVQGSTSGTHEILIGENQINGTDFSQMTRLAVWPDNECEVYLAQHLQESGYFETVVPPGKVLPILDEAGIKPKLKFMTQKERAEAFRLVGEKTGAQWVVATEDRGHEVKRGFIKRDTTTVRANLLIYSLKENRHVYLSSVELKIHLGGNVPNTDVMLRDGGIVMAQKILELRTGGQSNTTAKTASN